MRMFNLLATIVTVALLGTSTISRAGPVTVLVSDGVNPAVTMPFGGTAQDMAVASNFAGAIGTWSVNLFTVTGGSASSPHLDLSGTITSPGTPGTYLDLFVSQTDFTLGGSQMANFYAGIGGTTVGSVIWELFIDDGNSLFGGVPIAGSMNAGTPFSAERTVASLVDGLFSMTLHVRILHTNTAGSTSFDFESFAVPEPATLLLIGVGLLGVGLSRRRH